MVIQGEMSARRDVTIPVTIRDNRGDAHGITAVVDTGFTGYMTLPLVLIEALSLEMTEAIRITLGDGSERMIPQYAATVVWEGQDRPIEILEAEGLPLVGMGLLYGMVGTFHFSDGGPALLFRP